MPIRLIRKAVGLLSRSTLDIWRPNRVVVGLLLEGFLDKSMVVIRFFSRDLNPLEKLL